MSANDDAYEISGEAARLLRRMRTERLAARRDPIDERRMILVKTSATGSLGAGYAARDAILELERLGLIARQGRQGSYAVKAEAQAAPAELEGKETGGAPLFNILESPLLWLHRRKGADGKPLIDAAAFAAGERFRRDATMAALMPSVTTNWQRFEQSLPGSAQSPGSASDAMLAARGRMRAIYASLGGEMGDFLLDVCVFLTPLQQAEARRGWPARSGKVILRIALARLAAHYGITETAEGCASAPTAAWRADDARSGFGGWCEGSDAGQGGAGV